MDSLCGCKGSYNFFIFLNYYALFLDNIAVFETEDYVIEDLELESQLAFWAFLQNVLLDLESLIFLL